MTTTRQFTETIGLADLCEIDYTSIGAHGGKTLFDKIIANLQKAAHLARLIRPQHVSLAMNHGFIGQAIAAAGLHMPMINMIDYGGQSCNHIICQFLARDLRLSEWLHVSGMRNRWHCRGLAKP